MNQDDGVEAVFDDADPAYSSTKDCTGCGALVMPGPDHRCPNCGYPIV